MIREKISQAHGILDEEEIGLWLTFVRESETAADPVMDLIVGHHVTWQSAFAIAPGHPPTAIVGSLDEARTRESGAWETIGYREGIEKPLLEMIKRVDPATIAINFSENDVMADGLSHGMYLSLMGYLEKTPYAGRIVTAERVVSKLRGRKSPEEIRRIKVNVDLTEAIFDRVTGFVKPGMTEKELAAFILGEVDREGVDTSWERELCPSVFTGPESAGAHAGPTDRRIEPGHVLNIDFGTRTLDYCSDLQRTWYFLREGETEAPAEVTSAFETIRDAIRLAAEAIRPGMEGREIDAIARTHITSRGYDEYPHALGHQVGRSTHDGAGLLCPEWERYGNLPYLKIEESQVYTLEPRITIPGHGIATMEEIIVVRPEGGEFLSRPQTGLWTVG
ncbi:MAG: aminopeptidase P family protein [Candidatus Krumholzibacteriota bacterium]|nr:aminopeptidase P family protein [Candidatus Krumholzibacteriota bacterium]